MRHIMQNAIQTYVNNSNAEYNIQNQQCRTQCNVECNAGCIMQSAYYRMHDAECMVNAIVNEMLCVMWNEVSNEIQKKLNLPNNIVQIAIENTPQQSMHCIMYRVILFIIHCRIHYRMHCIIQNRMTSGMHCWMVPRTQYR